MIKKIISSPKYRLAYRELTLAYFPIHWKVYYWGAKYMFAFMVFILVIGFICSIFLIKYYSNKIGPTFMLYADAEVKRLATLVINKSIDKQLSMGMDVDSMFEIVRNNDGEIEMIDFNTVNVTNLKTSCNAIYIRYNNN